MNSELAALDKLCNKNSKVSCHYLIKKNGDVINIVPEKYISWHAGKSKWKNYKMLNSSSIGIEIQNPGHENNYKSFNKNQIKSLKKISLRLIKKYKIKKGNVLGHSDIAPERKKDPGEKFPWKKLSKHKIGIWHSLNKKHLYKFRHRNIIKKQKNNFFKLAKKIGYNINKNHTFIILAFQRRFRPEKIDGKIDLECLEIAKNLNINKFN